MKDVVQRLFAGMGKSKATPICPYVFHMYHTHEVLLPVKKKEYWIAKALLKHNVKPEEEGKPEALEGWNMRVLAPKRSERSRHKSIAG